MWQTAVAIVSDGEKDLLRPCMPFLFLCEAGAKQTRATALDAEYAAVPLPRAKNCLA